MKPQTILNAIHAMKAADKLSYLMDGREFGSILYHLGTACWALEYELNREIGEVCVERSSAEPMESEPIDSMAAEAIAKMSKVVA